MASNTSSMIDEILSCPICLDVLDAPKILQCLHRFCTKCLEDTLRTRAPLAGSFQCPICRQDTDLPPDGIGGIKNDFVMAAILENHKLEQELKQKKKERSCSSCDEIKLSEAFCADCGGFLCKECYQAHKTMKSLRNHVNSILLEDLQSGNLSNYVDKFTSIHKAPKCDQHADQILYFNCMTCSTLICPVCAPVSHKSHAIEEVATSFANILKQLEELCKISSEGDKILRNRLQTVNELQTRIETEAERCFSEIRSDTSKAETKITSEKEALIEKIEDEAKKRLEHLRHHNNDAVNTVKVRKDTCLTALNEMKSKLEEELMRSENAKRSAALFSEKTDMWSTLVAAPDVAAAFKSVNISNDAVPFPEKLRMIETTAKNLSDCFPLVELETVPKIENNNWSIWKKFRLRECSENNWFLSSISPTSKNRTFVASMHREKEYLLLTVDLNNIEDTKSVIYEVASDMDDWKTVPPSFCCYLNETLTIICVGPEIGIFSHNETFTGALDNTNIPKCITNLKGVADTALVVFEDRCLRKLKFFRRGYEISRSITTRSFTTDKNIETPLSIDYYQGKIMACDGHKAVALDRRGAFLHEYSYGMTKRHPQSICVDRFGSVFILQDLPFQNGSCRCVDEFTLTGRFVTSWKIPDNITFLATVPDATELGTVIAGAPDGTVTCYVRTEYGRHLTSLMRTAEERTTESMKKEGE
ncbi:hypothetical protein BSL78_08438 [Apostichopus japonicus]|uniref:Uncharacterized protein n=1 Tax=Stichopus japonicus TaxID=307972 RepID=A0A2G8L324_STIJA|nr:hypothetical protein BSL78_08438 [Apostichopus japonicus]